MDIIELQSGGLISKLLDSIRIARPIEAVAEASSQILTLQTRLLILSGDVSSKVSENLA